MVPLICLREVPGLSGTAVCFHMDTHVAVRCISHQGSCRSLSLLSVSETLFRLAESRLLQILPFLGEHMWVDALFHQTESSVEWSLLPVAFDRLVALNDMPPSGLFASIQYHRLLLFLDHQVEGFIYLFPPPVTQVMLRVCETVPLPRSFSLLHTGRHNRGAFICYSGVPPPSSA